MGNEEVRPALWAFQKSAFSLPAIISSTVFLLYRPKLTSDVSRPVRAVSEFLSGPTGGRDGFAFGEPIV